MDIPPQTLKAAKKSFKARGSTAVSAEEKRRLERGAQLLERASRIKEHEQRRKDQARKKEQKEPIRNHVLLGTQRKLDKFGYKSSQFHLGAFLKVAQPPRIVSPEPWDDQVEDDDLLDMAGSSPCQQTKLSAHAESKLQQPTTTNQQPLSPIGSGVDHWDSFLESSTQLAREISNEMNSLQTPPQPIPSLHFSSFGSSDFDISVEDLEELDASLNNHMPDPNQPVALQSSPKVSSSPPGEQSPVNNDTDRKLMPPPLRLPRFQAMQRKEINATATGSQVSISPRSSPANVVHLETTDTSCKDASIFGITIADLESLAAEDIELSQFDPGD